MESNNERFPQTVLRLRQEYALLRGGSNINIDVDARQTEIIDGITVKCFWYKGGTFLRLFDIPGTLSGDMLRLKSRVFSSKGHYELRGDTLRILSTVPESPEDIDDDENVDDLLKALPIVSVDVNQHFTKRCKYRSEIQNLLRLQGGDCPGQGCANVIQLLGKSNRGELVFPRMKERWRVLQFVEPTITRYRTWILQLINALKHLVSMDIVHRDLSIENLVFFGVRNKLILADLEGRWGQRSAPEIGYENYYDHPYTKRSDIYELGILIRCILYANSPVTRQVDWTVPEPFARVVEACTKVDPMERPSLSILQRMVEGIVGDEETVT